MASRPTRPPKVSPSSQTWWAPSSGRSGPERGRTCAGKSGPELAILAEFGYRAPTCEPRRAGPRPPRSRVLPWIAPLRAAGKVDSGSTFLFLERGRRRGPFRGPAGPPGRVEEGDV